MLKGVSKQSRLLIPIRKDVELIYVMYVERSFKTIKASNSHTKGCGTHVCVERSFKTIKASNSHTKGCGTHICHVCGKEFQEKRGTWSHTCKNIPKTLNVNIVPNASNPMQN